MNMRFKRVKLASIICILVVVYMAGCGKVEEENGPIVVEKEEQTISYEFGVAQIGDVVKTEKIRCTYRQMNEQEVSFSVGGRLVERVFVENGDKVKKGDLLVSLSGKDLQRQIDRLQYQIARNELLLGYAETDEAFELSGYWVNFLYYSPQTEEDRDALDERIADTQRNYRYTKEDYSDALEMDRKQLQVLQQELKSGNLYASMDGVVYNLKEHLEGSTARVDEVIMRILDTSECVFETEAKEFASYFTEGESVEMQLSFSSSGGDYELIPFKMDTWGDTQLFQVYSGPDGSQLEVGISGTIMLVTGRRENVLCVPANAVYEADGKAYVYVLNTDNMREVKWIETGLYGDTTVEITGGLEEGEKVIVKW